MRNISRSLAVNEGEGGRERHVSVLSARTQRGKRGRAALAFTRRGRGRLAFFRMPLSVAPAVSPAASNFRRSNRHQVAFLRYVWAKIAPPSLSTTISACHVSTLSSRRFSLWMNGRAVVNVHDVGNKREDYNHDDGDGKRKTEERHDENRSGLPSGVWIPHPRESRCRSSPSFGGRSWYSGSENLQAPVSRKI